MKKDVYTHKKLVFCLLAAGVMIVNVLFLRTGIETAFSVDRESAAEAKQPGIWIPLGEPGVGGWVTSVTVDPNNSKHLIIGGDLLGTGVSFNGGQSYRPGLGFKSCEIGDCSFHPQDGRIVWAGSMSGPYRSEDGGRTWREMRNGFPNIAGYHYSVPIEKILFDPDNNNRLLAFSGSSRRWRSPGKPDWGSVWESLDGGGHWTKISSVEKNIVCAAFKPGSSAILYIAVDQSGLFRSGDGGKNWVPINNGLPHLNIERVRVNPKMPGTIYISLGAGPAAEVKNGRKTCLPGGIFRSDDEGKSWRKMTVSLTEKREANPYLTTGFKAFDWSASDPNVLYAGDRAWNVDTVYRSIDGGKNWTKVLHRSPSDPKICKLNCAYFSGAGGTLLTIDPNDSKTVYGAGAEFVVRTNDGGVTWDDITAKKINASREHCWCGRGYSGLCCIGFYFDPYHSGRSIFTAMDAGKCWESRDFMKTWTFRGNAWVLPPESAPTDSESKKTKLDKSDSNARTSGKNRPQEYRVTPWGGGNMAAFAKDGSVYVTTGQGNSNGSILRGSILPDRRWICLRDQKNGLPDYNKCVATGIHVLPDDSSKVWAIIDRKLYRSDDFGEHWSILFDQEDLGWLAADPNDPLTFYVSGKENIWKTTDGQNFAALGGPKVAGRMAVDRLGRLWLAAYRGKVPGIWRFDEKKNQSDPLSGWTLLKKDFYIMNIAVDPSNEKRILAVGNDDPFHDQVRSSIWVSSDDGQTWIEAVDGLPVHRGKAVAFNPFNPEEIVLGTGGSGFFKTTFPK